jgi:DNA-binding CsgD family transcriptional regulator
MRDVATTFGFRSAFLAEYRGQRLDIEHILDSDESRRDWWQAYLVRNERPGLSELQDDAFNDKLLRFDASRFGKNQELRKFLEAGDVVEICVVPISYRGVVVGVAGFSGHPDLVPPQEVALQLIAYTLFAQWRSLRQEPGAVVSVSLTPRERQVIDLSAQGLTSEQIGKALGMSARTANQHVDNVSNKLGTRNRTHTVAEVIRHGLLN